MRHSGFRHSPHAGDTLRHLLLLRKKLSITLLAYLAVTGVVLYLIWSPLYFPTQDGPLHVYNGWLFGRLLFHSHPALTEQIYRIQWSNLSNSLSTYLLAILSFISTSRNSAKLLSSCGVVTLSFTSWFVCSKLGPKARSFAFLLMTIALSRFLFLGFYNFCLSLPLVLLVLEQIADELYSQGTSRPFRMASLMCAISLCHPAVFLIAATLLFVNLGVVFAFRRTNWRPSKLWHGATILPGMLCVLPFLLQEKIVPGAPSAGLSGAWSRINNFLLLTPMWSLTVNDIALSCSLAVALLLITLSVAATGTWSDRSLCFSASSVTVLALLACTPDTIAGGGAVSLRLALLLMMCLTLLVASCNTSARISLFAIAAGSIYIVAFSVTHYAYLAETGRLTAEYVRDSGRVTPGSFVLSLCLNVQGGMGQETFSYIQPMLHVAGYRDTDSALVEVNNAEADLSYFPVRYKVTPSILDVVGGRSLVEGKPTSVSFAGFNDNTMRVPQYVIISGAAAPRPSGLATGIPPDWLHRFQLLEPRSTGSPNTLILEKR